MGAVASRSSTDIVAETRTQVCAAASCIECATLTGPGRVGTIGGMASYEPQHKRWSRAEYDRMIDLGVFQPEDDIELLGGELMVAEPQGAPHYTAIRKMAKALEAAFGPAWEVRTEGPIWL